MQKKIITLLLVVMLVLMAGCKKEQQPVDDAPPPPSIPADIAETATAVLNAYMAQDWEALYDQIHLDIQTTLEKADFVAIRTEAQSHIKIKYKGFVLKEHKIINAWRNPANQEMQFENVAEVTYIVNVDTPKGEKEIQNVLYLAKGPEGKWKYLWVRN